MKDEHVGKYVFVGRHCVTHSRTSGCLKGSSTGREGSVGKEGKPRPRGGVRKMEEGGEGSGVLHDGAIGLCEYVIPTICELSV